MVERQGWRGVDRPPSRLSGVVAAPGGLGVSGRSEGIGHRYVVAAGVAPGVGVHSDHTQDARGDAGLLLQLPDHRPFRSLADLDEAPGEAPVPFERRMGATDQEDPAPVEEDGVHGEGRGEDRRTRVSPGLQESLGGGPVASTTAAPGALTGRAQEAPRPPRRAEDR